MSTTDYPGRILNDKERLPFGLGWEYRRRGWSVSQCPFDDEKRGMEFLDGYDAFICTDKRANAAMLRGIRKTAPVRS